MSWNEPTAWLLHIRILPYHSLYYLLLIAVDLDTIIFVYGRAELFTCQQARLACYHAEESDIVLDLLMDYLFVLLLLLEYQLVNVLEVLHVVKHCLEVTCHILLQWAQRLDVAVLKGVLRDWNQGTILLDLDNFLQKVYLASSKYIVEHVLPNCLESVLHFLSQLRTQFSLILYPFNLGQCI